MLMYSKYNCVYTTTMTRWLCIILTSSFLYICVLCSHKLQGGNEETISKIVDQKKYITFKEALLCLKDVEIHPKLQSYYLDFVMSAFVETAVESSGTDIENIWRSYVGQIFAHTFQAFIRTIYTYFLYLTILGMAWVVSSSGRKVCRMCWFHNVQWWNTWTDANYQEASAHNRLRYSHCCMYVYVCVCVCVTLSFTSSPDHVCRIAAQSKLFDNVFYIESLFHAFLECVLSWLIDYICTRKKWWLSLQ